MKISWQSIATAFGFVFVAGCLILVGIYPYRPNSIAGWLALFVLALPAILLLELSGEKLLKPKFISRLGRAGRIAYGVLVMGTASVVILVVFHFLEPFFDKWGSLVAYVME